MTAPTKGHLAFDESAGNFKLDGRVVAFASVSSTNDERRRLCAAWNAFEDLSTEAIEALIEFGGVIALRAIAKATEEVINLKVAP
jgi:hypothetical protein